jgi:predicted nucleic acid-binding protein
MNIVDSSAWLEYFAEGSNARHFAKVIENAKELLVPSITLLEVFKRIALQHNESTALHYVAVMQQSKVVELDSALAIRAAALGVRFQLPLADSIIYATAQAANATVWTQDADFDGLAGVRYFAKVKS